MRRTTLFTAVALVAALAAGCGADPKPTFSPSESPTTSSAPTTSAAPQAGPPEMPDAAKKHTKAGAEAFAKHFVAMVNYANANLDTAGLSKLVNAGCDGCQGGINGINQIRDSGGHVDGGVWSIKELRVNQMSFGADFKPMEVRLTFSSTPEIVTYANGKRKTYPGGPATDRVVLSPVREGWKISNLEVIK